MADRTSRYGNRADAGTLDKPRTIYIVRHGATKLNNDIDTSVDRIRGWKDIPLVKEGREQARKAAEKLKHKDIRTIVCSDLSRAHETADIIGEIIGAAVEPTNKLRPWNLGTLQGTTTKEALPQIAKYVQEKPDESVPNGESFNKFKTRAFQGFAEAVDEHPDETILIVTHHRNERLIEAWDRAGQPEDHEIDLDTFLEKGDPPGGIKIIHASEAALKGNDSMNRMSRYDNPPKAKKNGAGAAKSEAEKTAGSPPDMKDAGEVGKMGSDPGPENGHDATWGVVAERHKREHGDMLKRHAAEHVAHGDTGRAMVDRHQKEETAMRTRHEQEWNTHFAGPGNEIEKGGAEGPKLGKSESKGAKGAEA